MKSSWWLHIRFAWLLLPLGICLLGTLLYAQNPLIDSLKQRLAQPKMPDSLRLELLLRLSAVSGEFNPITSEKYGRTALEFAKKLGSLPGLARAYRYLGTSYLGRSEYAKAFQLYDSSRQVAEQIGDEEALSAVWTNMGLVFESQGDYVGALEYALRALRIDERIGKQNDIATSFLNIGSLYYRQKEHQMALEYYGRSLAIFYQIGLKDAVAEALHGIGRVHKDRRDYQKALIYFDSSLTLMRPFDNRRVIGEITYDIGSTYLFQKKSEKARIYLEESLEIRQMRQDKSGIAQTSSALGTLYWQENNLAQAKTLFLQSLAIANELGLRELQVKILAHLADMAKKQGQFQQALAYQQQAFVFKDSIFSNTRSREIGRLEMMQQIEKREAENQLLLKDRALQNANQARERVVLGAVSLGLMLSLGVGMLLWRFGQRQQLSNVQLLRQQALLENQAREIETINTELQESNLRLMTANEELQSAYTQIQEQADALQAKNERLEELDKEKNVFLSIAAHDLKNPLATIRLSAEMLERFLHKIDVAEQRQRLQHISNTVDRMMQIINDLLNSNALESGTMTTNIVPISPGEILMRLQAEYEVRASLKSITLETAPSVKEYLTALVSADANMLVSVFENLLSNAIKFSPLKTTVTLELEKTENTCLIRFRDQGPGISEEDKKKLFGKFTRLSARPTGGEHSTGLGLSIVKKMVEAMKGRVWCESELGKGATFIVELPTHV